MRNEGNRMNIKCNVERYNVQVIWKENEQLVYVVHVYSLFLVDN